jgi:hypothetical protein
MSPLPSSPRAAPELTRREFVALGGAAVLTALIPVPAFAGSTFLREPGTMLAIADTRCVDSVAFAGSLARRGASVLPLHSDIGGLWFDALEPRLSAHATAIAGLTLESDLFILKRLAAASGLSTIYVGSHDWRNGQGSRHGLRAGIALDQIAACLAQREGPWAARLGEAIASTHFPALPQGLQELSVKLDIEPSPGSPKFFVSWVVMRASSSR